MAELVDALDSKSSSARSAGSIPARGTIFLTIALTAAESPDGRAACDHGDVKVGREVGSYGEFGIPCLLCRGCKQG
jgi:hypothetical protein